MYKYLMIAVLCAALSYATELPLTQEYDFLGVPGYSDINSQWLMDNHDDADFFKHIVDIDVLKLSPADYRVVILDAHEDLFATYRIDQHASLSIGDVVRSGANPADCFVASSICQIKSGKYFDPSVDRVAVVFKLGAAIGIYQFNGISNSFTLERTVTNPAFVEPISIFSAFNQFFIVDSEAKTIFRTDNQGTILSQYGHEGIFDDGYYWMSNLVGYVDASNVAHMYIGDGANERVDHLTATAGDNAIYLESQAVAKDDDLDGMNIHQVALIQDEGIVGFNKDFQRVLYWDNLSNLPSATRSETFWGTEENPAIHAKGVCGRFIATFLMPSGWTMRSYRITGIPVDNPIFYPRDRWRDEDSPVYITDSYHIKAGEHLTIYAGVEVLLDAGASIVVDEGATLTIAGTASHMVSFDAMDAGEKWNCIQVNGEIEVDYATFENAGGKAAIYTQNPRTTILNPIVSITNSEFIGNGVMLTGNSKDTQFIDNCIIHHVMEQPGFQASNCYVDINSLTVHNCAYANTYLSKVSGSFDNCVFDGRASEYGVFLNNETCNPTFTCCQFIDLASETSLYGTSVYSATGCNPEFGRIYSADHANVFSDDSRYLLTIQGSGALPVLHKHPNDFIQNSQDVRYMLWLDYPIYSATFSAMAQYWNHTPDISYFSPSIPAFWDFSSPEPNPFGVCGGAASSISPNPNGREHQTLDEDSVIVDTLLYAIDLEQQELFAQAQGLYLYVIQNAVDPSTIWSAASRIVTTEVHLNHEEVWIPALIEGLVSQFGSTYNAVLHGKRILANYYLNIEQYESALNLCVELLEDSLGFEDSIFVATDINLIQMAAGIIEWEDGILDESFANRIPPSMRIESVDEGLAREQQLISMLDSVEGTEPHNWDNVIPEKFALYQNYPNPFNPTTQIRYDLPEAVRVKINVYNTLGQFVTQLKDGIQAAGAYTVIWDGKNAVGHDVATGMYIFRMEAGNFTDTKKMLLLK